MTTTKTPPAKKTTEQPAAAVKAASRTAPDRMIHIEDPNTTDLNALSPSPILPEQRLRMIQEAAYFRAEQRDFMNGDPSQDWLEAEAEVDRLLQNHTGATTEE